METTWIEMGGFVIRAPVTAATNLVLGLQCSLYFRGLKSSPGPRSRLWGGFFAMMAIATFAGVLKHGFQHELSEGSLFIVLWVTNVAGGIATYCAQRATSVTHAPEQFRGRFDRVCEIQLFVFLAANVVLGPRFLLLVVNLAVGLLPVIAAEALAFRRGHAEAGWIVGGLSLSILAGSVYLAGLSIGPWLNHIDIAHVLMGVGFWLIVRAFRPPIRFTSTRTGGTRYPGPA